MHDFAEKFIQEYSNAFLAMIGAKFIKTTGAWNETIELTESLLNHEVPKTKFPSFSDMKTFYNEIWNTKEYSRILRFNFSVEFDNKAGSNFLYYKAFI